MAILLIYDRAVPTSDDGLGIRQGDVVQLLDSRPAGLVSPINVPFLELTLTDRTAEQCKTWLAVPGGTRYQQRLRLDLLNGGVMVALRGSSRAASTTWAVIALVLETL